MTTLDDLAARYDAFLVDQFGVLLDGSAAYAYAPKALSQLAATGKPVILLSNSGKRSAPNAARLYRLGFAEGSFRIVLSSGEAAFRALSRAGHPAGTKVWLHSRDDDDSVIAGLGLERVDRPEQAALLILAGSHADVMTLGEYADLLSPAARAALPMLCINPDIEMLTPQGKRAGAGRIAALYGELGGRVDYIGKPHPLIYVEAATMLAGIAPDRVLCIGDSPAHDIAGGKAAGHATALVQTGIHAGLDLPALHALCREEGATPDHILPRFAFDGS